jgi:curli biogenesis system outer membrane secretion channel CsgG
MKKTFALLVATALIAVVFAPLAIADEKPRIAVLEFANKADNQWWHRGGASAAQDVFVTELVKSGKFRVIDRERLDALMREKNLTLSGDVDASSAIKIGKLLGVKYFLTGAVTEYGNTKVGGSGFGISAGKKKFVAALNARIIDAETGEILWADESSKEQKSLKVRVFGVGGGVDDDRMFDKVMKPAIKELAASIVAVDLG